jgi:hypothetical protein
MRQVGLADDRVHDKGEASQLQNVVRVILSVTWINLFHGLDFTCLSMVPLRVLRIGVLYKCFAILLSILL